ncbi:hypothetical protein DFQ13_1107 [Actinokineospora spheciospongiae]|nr:hypothetical protein DFQ13_1107 [Actinokineospora spheciospongiae]
MGGRVVEGALGEVQGSAVDGQWPTGEAVRARQAGHLPRVEVEQVRLVPASPARVRLDPAEEPAVSAAHRGEPEVDRQPRDLTVPADQPGDLACADHDTVPGLQRVVHVLLRHPPQHHGFLSAPHEDVAGRGHHPDSRWVARRQLHTLVTTERVGDRDGRAPHATAAQPLGRHPGRACAGPRLGHDRARGRRERPGKRPDAVRVVADEPVGDGVGHHLGDQPLLDQEAFGEVIDGRGVPPGGDGGDFGRQPGQPSADVALPQTLRLLFRQFQPVHGHRRPRDQPVPLPLRRQHPGGDEHRHHVAPGHRHGDPELRAHRRGHRVSGQRFVVPGLRVPHPVPRREVGDVHGLVPEHLPPRGVLGTLRRGGPLHPPVPGGRLHRPELHQPDLPLHPFLGRAPGHARLEQPVPPQVEFIPGHAAGQPPQPHRAGAAAVGGHQDVLPLPRLQRGLTVVRLQPHRLVRITGRAVQPPVPGRRQPTAQRRGLQLPQQPTRLRQPVPAFPVPDDQRPVLRQVLVILDHPQNPHARDDSGAHRQFRFRRS